MSRLPVCHRCFSPPLCHTSWLATPAVSFLAASLPPVSSHISPPAPRSHIGHTGSSSANQRGYLNPGLWLTSCQVALCVIWLPDSDLAYTWPDPVVVSQPACHLYKISWSSVCLEINQGFRPEIQTQTDHWCVWTRNKAINTDLMMSREARIHHFQTHTHTHTACTPRL